MDSQAAEMYALRAQRGDRDAEERLLEAGRHGLRVIARRFYAPSEEAEDMLVAAQVGFLEGVRAWRPGGASVLGFALHCARRRVFSELTTANRAKRLLLLHAVANAAPAKGEEDDAEAGLEALADPRWRLTFDLALEPDSPEEALEQLLGDRLERLTPRQRAVVGQIARMPEVSYDDIGEPLGLSRKQVDNAIQLSRRKLGKLS